MPLRYCSAPSVGKLKLLLCLWLINANSLYCSQPVACRGLVMPGRLFDWMPPTKFQYWAVAYRWWSLFLDTQYTVCDITTWQTNFLANLVDTTCIFRNAGAAVGQGEQQNSWEQWKLIINKLSRYKLSLFLFINNVILKNNNRNHRKSFRIIWVPELLQ